MSRAPLKPCARKIHLDVTTAHQPTDIPATHEETINHTSRKLYQGNGTNSNPEGGKGPGDDQAEVAGSHCAEGGKYLEQGSIRQDHSGQY